MSNNAIPYRRRGDILRLLHQQGPLSVVGLKQMLEPKMSSKGIALSLRRLRKNGYVVRRFDSLPNNVGHFYQLSNSQDFREDISKITGIMKDDLTLPKIRDQELIHSQQCALWMHNLGKLFPEAKMVRDFQILHHERSKNVLQLSPDRLHLRPDIMIHFPKTDKNPDIDIAVEIERSRKADERVIQKIKKMAHETHLDGIVYVCEDDSIADVARSHYNKKVRESCLTSPYKANFLMFIPDHCLRWGENIYVINSDLKGVDLKDWVGFLKKTSHNFRRDHQLTMWGDDPTSEELQK